MNYKYYSCEWLTMWNEVDVVHLFEALDIHQCELSIVNSRWDRKNGNQHFKIGVKTPSSEHLRNLISEIGDRYSVKSWKPLAKNDFDKGKNLANSVEGREHILGNLHYLYQIDTSILDRILHNEEHLEIYVADWLIGRRFKHMWIMFDMADSIGFPLSYVRVEDEQNLQYIRFFAVVRSPLMLQKFIEGAAQEIGLTDWQRIPKYKLPNSLRFDPRRIGIYGWSEELNGIADHNRKVADNRRR